MQAIAQQRRGLIKYGGRHRKVNVKRVTELDPPSK